MVSFPDLLVFIYIFLLQRQTTFMTVFFAVPVRTVGTTLIFLKICLTYFVNTTLPAVRTAYL